MDSAAETLGAIRRSRCTASADSELVLPRRSDATPYQSFDGDKRLAQKTRVLGIPQERGLNQKEQL